jgi:hypothetical protein
MRYLPSEVKYTIQGEKESSKIYRLTEKTSSGIGRSWLFDKRRLQALKIKKAT